MPNMGGVFFTADIFGGALGAQGDPIFRVGSDRRVFDPVPEPTFYLALAVPPVQTEQRTKKASSLLKVGTDMNIKPGVNPPADIGGSLGVAAMVQVNAG
jgi:hypothetical protein